MLGLATIAGPHLVILDEPTNHLDIDSRAALIEALNDYSGAVILISHDRYLLEACADRLWRVADGSVAPFEGDLEDYSRLVVNGARESTNGAARESGRDSRAAVRRAAAEKRSELAPLRRQIAAIEKEMARLSAEIARIDQALGDGTLFARDPAQAATLAKTRSDCATALHAAETEWLEASARYETEMADAAAL
jgi:ATP-binding cassette subfamily F protein 3